MNNENLLRLFIAVELSQEIKESVFGLAEKLFEVKTGLRLVSRENLHITMRFLGKADGKIARGAGEAMAEAVLSIEPFALRVRETGAFPSTGSPAVLWAGVEDKKQMLRRLSSELEEKLVKTGLSREAKPFHPHVTVARVKKNIRKADIQIIKNWLNENKGADMGKMAVRGISLFDSTLTSKKAVYRLVEKAFFKEK